MPVTIFHNPRCSKSRQTLALLENQGIKPTIIEYLKTPITKDKLIEILSLLGMAPRDLMRKKEEVYAEKGLDNPSLSDARINRHHGQESYSNRTAHSPCQWQSCAGTPA